jgi:hypothetical protein
MARKLKDYGITMRDAAGRSCRLSINADSIMEHMQRGASLENATAEVQDNAFQNAIARGEIGADAWLVN